MSLQTNATAQPTGFRRLNLTMMTVRDRADQFAGVPRGTAKPLTYLAAFQEAEPYLGLPPHAFKLISFLVRQTMPVDWEEGSRPIAWPSARLQQEFLGLSAARVKALNRALYEAGLFVIRDNEQGKRYGRRGPDKRIIEAYGFDLTPIAQRYDEFVHLAAEARAERNRMKDLRRRVTMARRAIRQTGEMLDELGPMPEGWRQLAADTAALTVAARRQERSEELALVARSIERLKAEAEQWLRAASQSVDTSPEGLVCDPHTTTTNLSIDLKDTVIAAEGSSRGEGPAPTRQPTAPAIPVPMPKLNVERAYRLRVGDLCDLAPRLGELLNTGRSAPTMRDAVDAAGQGLRHELGVSVSLWHEACRVMGQEEAALALALVSTKPKGYFKTTAGGYFAGMVRKAEANELHMDRTLWKLREEKWGKGARGRAN
jgi:replication initiation protein RepC